MPEADTFRIALATYRGNPRSGGQGIYVARLGRELCRLGHDVTVVSGPPYPHVDDFARLVRLDSLDLYGGDEPRYPRPGEMARSIPDLVEGLVTLAGGFGEPLAFSLRSRRILAEGGFDVIHDNQGLGYGLLPLLSAPAALVATIHHPVTVDRDIAFRQARGPVRRFGVRRWYAFTAMQRRVAERVPRIVTVSERSRADLIADFGISPDAVDVIPVGVDTSWFHPDRAPTVPGRIVTLAPPDVALKGFPVIVEAFAKVRTDVDCHLVALGTPRPGGTADELIDRLGVREGIEFRQGATDAEVADLLSSAEVVVVPSYYEGFSLPALEALASGSALVASDAGAIADIVGDSGAGIVVTPGDAGELSDALVAVLGDTGRSERMGKAGRERVLGHYEWREIAARTVDVYRRAIEEKQE